MSNPLQICLWFDGNGKEAAEFYCSIFKDSKLKSAMQHRDAEKQGNPNPVGDVLTQEFELNGMKFFALNGGPNFKFNEAVSICISTKDQEETDYYWEKLISGGGQPSACGWLKDKYGLSWQVTPTILPELLKSGDPATAERVMRSMMTMSKIVIADLEAAAKGQ